MAVANSPAQMMAVLQSWGIDPYQVLTSVDGYSSRYGGSGRDDPAATYLKTLQSQLGDFSTEGKTIKMVANGDDEIGLFPSFQGVKSAMGFDANGNFYVAPPAQVSMPGTQQIGNAQYDPYTGTYTGYNSGTGQFLYGSIGQTGGFGSSLLAQPYGINTRTQPRTFDFGRDVGERALREALQKGIYEGRANPHYNSQEIADVFSRDEFKDSKPMSYEQYFRESQKLYSATINDGSSMSGPGLFNYMDVGQQAQALSDINTNYGNYINEYQQAAVNFLNNQNNTAWQKQAATDTDPSKREQAQYGVTGSPAPTGASGWGRGSVQSSEGFQDMRKRGWGQSEFQGV